jgi:excisionase family DNA binding protein
MEDSELSAAAPADNPPLHSLMHSVPLVVAAEILHVGRSKLYDLLGAGKLEAVKDGTRVLVTVESIRRYQASMPRASFAPPKPPRLDNLDRLHAKQRQRAAQRRAKRAQRHRSKAWGE